MCVLDSCLDLRIASFLQGFSCKRTLRGTYVAVEPFHLSRYVDEQVFRFNNRKITPADRFALAMSQVAGKRLTYSELTGKDTDSLHTSETGTGEAQALLVSVRRFRFPLGSARFILPLSLFRPWDLENCGCKPFEVL